MNFDYMIVHTKRGDFHVSPAELRQAGIQAKEIERWTNGHYLPLVALTPLKNVELLYDFIELAI